MAMKLQKIKKKMGRPRNLEPPKQVRVPVSLIPAIEVMVSNHKKTLKKQVQS